MSKPPFEPPLGLVRQFSILDQRRFRRFDERLPQSVLRPLAHLTFHFPARIRAIAAHLKS